MLKCYRQERSFNRVAALNISFQKAWQAVPKDGGHGTSVATDKVLDLRGPLSKSSRVLVTESKAENIAKKHRKSQHASFH